MALSELLAQRRPHRADAARNFEVVIAAARTAFTEQGAEIALEGIPPPLSCIKYNPLLHYPAR